MENSGRWESLVNKRISIASNFKNIGQAVNEVLHLLKDIKANESDIFDIRLSLEEALINAIKYGNKFDEQLTVDIEFIHNHSKVTITIKDQGDGFDYHSLPDPTKEENLLKARGRGVFLIKHLMDKVEFNKKGNHLTMTKYLKGEN
jgi:serine/threonine-protein kinase RsbW